MFGTLWRVQTPLHSNVAGSIAIAEFFAPIIDTSPFSGVPPVITNFSINISILSKGVVTLLHRK